MQFHCIWWRLAAACVSFNLQFKVQMQDFKLKMWREKVMTSVFCTTAMWLPGKVENVWNSAWKMGEYKIQHQPSYTRISIREVMQHQTFSYMTLPTFLSLNIWGVEIGISARLLNNLIVFLMVVLRAGDERMVGWGHHWVEENKTIFHVRLC